MSYNLIIPQDIMGKMYNIRTNTGIAIRRQAIMAMEKYVEEMKGKSIDKLISA